MSGTSPSMPDFKSMPRNDQILLGSGLLVFIVSLFFPYYGGKLKGEAAAAAHQFGSQTSSSTNAWHGLAAFGLILLLLALIVSAAQTFAKASLPEIPVSYNVVASGLALLGALFVIIKSFDLPSGGGSDFSYGLRWGGWLLLILVIVQAVFTVLRFRESGDALPWQQSAAPPAV
jgi:hypothetical protein